jgi:hypothetical protein
VLQAIGRHNKTGSKRTRKIEAPLRGRLLITRKDVVARTAIELIAHPSNVSGIIIKLIVPGSWQISASAATVNKAVAPGLKDHRSTPSAPFAKSIESLYVDVCEKNEIRCFGKHQGDVADNVTFGELGRSSIAQLRESRDKSAHLAYYV